MKEVTTTIQSDSLQDSFQKSDVAEVKAFESKVSIHTHCQQFDDGWMKSILGKKKDIFGHLKTKRLLQQYFHLQQMEYVHV